jgi:hypothetical protein
VSRKLPRHVRFKTTFFEIQRIVRRSHGLGNRTDAGGHECVHPGIQSSRERANAGGAITVMSRKLGGGVAETGQQHKPDSTNDARLDRKLTGIIRPPNSADE